MAQQKLDPVAVEVGMMEVRIEALERDMLGMLNTLAGIRERLQPADASNGGCSAEQGGLVGRITTVCDALARCRAIASEIDALL